MTEIRQISGWNMSAASGAMYEQLLATLGSEEFGTAVRDAVMSVAGGVRRIYLFEATGREKSSLQYYFGEPGLVDVFPAYLKSYLRLDPVLDAYRAAPQVSDIALQRVRPQNIASAEFRRRVFDAAGIVERVSIIQRGAESWRVMNVARHASEGLFSDGEIDALVGVACLALPMLPFGRAKQHGRGQLSVAQLEDRFASRFTQLTLRERQVCARAAMGMSVEATARELEIANTSVLTYRRRAYQRLRVSTHYQLCSLITH